MRHTYGRVVELVDSLDSGSSVHCGRAGSSPASPTKETVERLSLFLPVHGRQKQHNSLVFQENRKTRELFHSLKSFLPICKYSHLFQSALSATGRQSVKQSFSWGVIWSKLLSIFNRASLPPKYENMIYKG